MEPCAHRCSIVADLVAGRARDRGTSERSERVALGLDPVLVPLIPPRPELYVCRHGATWSSRLAAAECPCIDPSTSLEVSP